MAADNSVTPTDASREPRENDPKDGAVYQQRMKAWYPILHPVWVIAALFVIGVVFIPVGFRLKQISDDVVELSVMYDGGKGTGECAITQPNQDKTCTHTFTVDRDMTSPILVYYEINNFHQNHRKYYQSRDDPQLLGRVGGQTKIQASDCEPLNQLGDITLNPCGLIANTLFNDIFKLVGGNSSDGKTLKMLENGVAWQSDLDYKYSQPTGFKSEQCTSCEDCACNPPDWSCINNEAYSETNDDGDTVCYRYFYPNDNTTQYLHETYPKVISPIKGVMEERFIVWMRTAALPRFRKLYGFIDKDISKGEKLTFEINANWIVNRFKGSKSLVLSTTSMFGGKNPALGNYFIGVGIACLLFALLFGLKHFLKPRKLADRKYLKYKEE
mmetsp:Transcript_11412/g.13479  ORF Transcript_11412/g.13479 Transcript_11412/m.13479 type:complete len:385 (-) Transcript_11412:224-1378(-)